MFIRIAYLLSALLTGCLCMAQTISGKVVRSDNEEPLQNASVYINGTTLGSSTNDSGYFQIGVPGPGQFELISSIIGFETIVFKVQVNEKGRRLLIKMDPKSIEMKNVLVLSRETRSEWLKIFKQNFLGITDAAGKCMIENEDDIQFESIGKTNGFKSFSEVPLIIVNEELGYKISFDLVEFLYDPDKQTTHYVGYSKFEELNKSRKNKYVKKRERYYEGSTMHFYHSLIAGTLKQEGYSLRISRSVHKDSAALIDSSIPGIVIGKQHRNADYIGYTFSVPGDSVLFRLQSAEGEKLLLNWDGRLEVRYDKDPFIKNTLYRKGNVRFNTYTGTISYINLLNRPLQIDRSGALYDPLSVQYLGFWVYEKFATILPLDYRPETPGTE